MRKTMRTMAALLGLLAATRAAAQEAAPAEKTGRTSLRVLPVFFTGPLTGAAFGATAIRVRSFADTAQRPVTVRGAVIYSVKNQFESVVDLDAWTKHNVWRIASTLEFNIFPSPFYGIGPATTKAQEEDYTPRSIAWDGALQRQVLPSLFLRGTVRFQNVNIKSVAPNGQLAQGTIIGSAGFTVVSLGAGLQYDTRDNVYSPRHGSLVQSRVAIADTRIGASRSYALYGIDLRTYLPVTRTGILALQAQMDASTGAVPFFDLPNLGGPEGLRPYVNGRWRDRLQFTTQVEYRAPLFWKIGGTLFTGGGLVAPRFGAIDLAYFRPQVGAGLRYLILPKERATLRADLAFGSDKAVAFTLGFAEAF